MKRREFMLAAGATTALAGCEAVAPGATSNSFAAGPDFSGIDVYIPGHHPSRAEYKGVPVLEHPYMRRALPKGYDQNITMMTRFGFDGSIRQALFPVAGHDIAISPNKRFGYFATIEHGTYVTFNPRTLNRVALGKPFREGWVGGGHSEFLSDDLLAITERAPNQAYTGKVEDHFGHVTLRDPRNLKVIGDFSTYGIAPHEIRLIEDGKYAVMANYGTTVPPGGTNRYAVPRHTVEASVTVVEVESGKLVDKFFGNNPKELRHLCAKDRETIFVVQAVIGRAGDTANTKSDPSNRQGEAYLAAATVRINTQSGKLVELGSRKAQRLMRHGSSIEYDETHDEVICSYPATHQLMVFDAASGELKHQIDCQALGMADPSGVALLPGQNHYVVTGYDQHLFVFERGTHKLKTRLSHALRNIGHNHIVAA